MSKPASQPTPANERGAAVHRAGRVRRSVHGPMWHGAAVNELLAEVTFADAWSRPIANAHTIWELVLHMTAWAEIASERVHGKALADPSPDRNFPPMPSRASARAWTSARQALTAAHEQLAENASTLAAEARASMVPGQTYSVGVMIDGVIEHTTYHGGQIALLKRALLNRAPIANTADG